jgi:predicted DNA-binding protein
VTRNGRNGKGARVRRRMTVYLPPELAQRLEDRAHATRTEISEIVAAALEKHL